MGGGAWRRSSQIYNRSISLSVIQYHLVLSKMDPRAVSLRFGAADFVRLAKCCILRVRCRMLQSGHNCGIDDENGGWGWSYPIKE